MWAFPCISAKIIWLFAEKFEPIMLIIIKRWRQVRVVSGKNSNFASRIRVYGTTAALLLETQDVAHRRAAHY